MHLEVFLYDISPHRMADQYRMCAQAVCNPGHIRSIPCSGMPANSISALAVSMSTQAKGMDFIAMFCKIGQEILPAPCPMPRAVHKQQGSGMGLFRRML